MLAVNDIAVTYGGVIAAVDGVSLQVPDNGVVALLGANGAGKTTMLRAISGLLRLHGGAITRGSITFDGKRIDRQDATRIVRRGIAQVLEGRRLFAELSVDENLRTGAISVRDGAAVRRAYERVMELFPVLRERHTSMAGYLSGGEQQMVAIGRALMATPRLLVLDEPSLGLAPFLVGQIRDIIAEISRGGTAVCWSSRTRRWRSPSRPLATCWRPGMSRWTHPAADLLRDESVRKFYLGLHEEGGDSDFASLRTHRPERNWAL